MWRLFIISCLIGPATFAQSVLFRLSALPGNHPATDPVFLAGSFNQWNPADPAYQFRKDSIGNYVLQTSITPGNHAYKLTRGSWEKVECSSSGSSVGNRQFSVSANIEVAITVEGWQDLFEKKPPSSTASPRVSILDTAFYIPQLKRYRSIRLYLPANYSGTKKRYPVLYMHDGQNLFDRTTSYAGEWGVDEYLDTAIGRSCIVVAIDNGGAQRMNEYCPYDFRLDHRKEQQEKGEGKEYVSFIVHTLKPYIDQKLRTLRKRESTFIAGSSMGGLISLYAVLAYPRTFGGAGVFSPSVWICKKEIVAFANERAAALQSRIFFYSGKKESNDMVPDMLAVFDAVKRRSKRPMTVVIRDGGQHNEKTWQNELPVFFEWLIRN